MEIILLERIPKLGQMGDSVRVRDGYARNYLLPQGKAIRSTEENRQRFESQRAQLEARNLELKHEAESIAERLNGLSLVVIRQAGERGQLYGSVSTRDIAEKLSEGGFSALRSQVELNSPIKMIGLTDVPIRLHPEVAATITINVARTGDEAERQARGEDPTRMEDDDEAEALDEAMADAAAFFEDETQAEEAAEEAAESEGRP